jgi:hypothetical protein
VVFEKLSGRAKVTRMNVETWATLKEIVINYILNLCWTKEVGADHTTVLSALTSSKLDDVLNIGHDLSLAADTSVVLDTLLLQNTQNELSTATDGNIVQNNEFTVDGLRNILQFIATNVEYTQLTPVV